MKKWVSILLLVTFAFDFAGVIILFHVQQFRIRREIKSQIKRGLSEDQLQIISLTPQLSADMIWIKDHEFALHGEMFDIVHSDTCADGSIEFYCINDKQEKILFAQLDDLVRKSTQNEDPAGRTASELFQLFSFYMVPPSVELSIPFRLPAGIYADWVPCYSSPSLLATCPPPWASNDRV